MQFQRESLVRKVEVVSDDDARRRFVASGTILLWLLNDGSEVPDDVFPGDSQLSLAIERVFG